MVIRCPNCGTEYHINDNLLGRWAECASCGKRFVIGQTYSRPILGGGMKILHRVWEWLFDVWMRARPLLVNHKRTAVRIGALLTLVILVLCFSSSRDVEFYDHGIDIEDAPVSKNLLWLSMEDPEIGTCYVNDLSYLRVRQMFAEGVCVGTDKEELFVRTKDEYVDGAKLKPGLYVCSGRAKLRQPNGNRTLWLFDSVERDLAVRKVKEAFARWEAEKVAKENAEQEAAEKRAIEKAKEIALQQKKIALQREELALQREKKEVEDQDNRRMLVEKVFGGIDFVHGNIWIDNNLMPYVKVEVSNYIAADIERRKISGDWLEVFNLVCRLVNKKADYKRFPSRDKIMDVVGSVRNLKGSVNIDIAGDGLEANRDEHLMFITYEDGCYPLKTVKWSKRYVSDGSTWTIEFSESKHVAYCHPYGENRMFLTFPSSAYQKIFNRYGEEGINLRTQKEMNEISPAQYQDKIQNLLKRVESCKQKYFTRNGEKFCGERKNVSDDN